MQPHVLKGFLFFAMHEIQATQLVPNPLACSSLIVVCKLFQEHSVSTFDEEFDFAFALTGWAGER